MAEGEQSESVPSGGLPSSNSSSALPGLQSNKEVVSLCQTCVDVILQGKGLDLEQSDEETHFHRHHISMRSWKDSCDAYCPICKTLWDQLTRPQQASIEVCHGMDQLTVILISYDDDIVPLAGQTRPIQLLAAVNPEATRINGSEFIVIRCFSLDPSEGRSMNLKFVAQKYLSELEARYYEPTKDAGSLTVCSQSWSIAERWLSTCVQTHQQCRQVKSTGWLPTRLLDVGTSVHDKVQLVLRTEVGLQENYLTLSHCWGDAKIFKLLKTTFDHLRSGIESKDLPLTFQHAIEITRRLQIRYLWIDSLCIMQDADDRTDWLKEAALMHQVYADSYLNIAATGATDSHDGLVFHRPGYELQPVIVSLPVDNPWTNGVETSYALIDKFFIEHGLMQAPLNKRGWVLQERLLAPRVLHFNSRQLYWECQEGLLCERYPTKLPSWMMKCGFATFKSMTRAYGRQILSEIPTNSEEALSLWHRIVRAYSGTMLTYPHDKVIALSGIAKYMQGVLKDDYVAGMWHHYLPCSLMWYIDDARDINQQPSTRPSSYRAPTWSWLSVDGIVTSMDSETDPRELHFEVIGTKMQYLTQDPTGIVLSGLLYLRGRLRSMQLVRVDPNNLYDRRWNMVLNGKVFRVGRRGAVVHLDVYEPGFERSNREGELYAMPGVGPRTKENLSSYWHKILLLRCVNHAAGMFERFGLASIRTDEDQNLFQILFESDDNEQTFPHIKYDSITRLHDIVVR